MTNRAEATAAPGTFTLDDVEYQMSPLNDKIIGALDTWLRTATIRMGRAAAREEPMRADQNAIMTTAFLVARQISWFTEGPCMMRTIEGSARFLYETTRENNPDATIEQFTEAIRDDPAGLTDAWDVFELLNPSRESKKKTATAPTTPMPPTPTKQKSTESSPPDTDGPPTTSPG